MRETPLCHAVIPLRYPAGTRRQVVRFWAVARYDETALCLVLLGAMAVVAIIAFLWPA